jgi:hypothetical protein
MKRQQYLWNISRYVIRDMNPNLEAPTVVLFGSHFVGRSNLDVYQGWGTQILLEFQTFNFYFDISKSQL